MLMLVAEMHLVEQTKMPNKEEPLILKLLKSMISLMLSTISRLPMMLLHLLNISKAI
jgi:hypothetical protein